ncbi:MAG: RidA family protein [Desulfovibrio sp.]|nr:RidA family protein [Desulfovibrio sp.]
MKTVINTQAAPAALGPYSQAIKTGNMVFVSGQLGIDPATGEMSASAEDQARQALKNLRAILDAAGAKPHDVVKTTVFLGSMNDFKSINDIYADFFGEHKPARSCFEVACLPKNAKIEIEAIVVID